MEISFVRTDLVTRHFPTVRVEKIHLVELDLGQLKGTSFSTMIYDITRRFDFL
jgi:hypothetical protein